METEQQGHLVVRPEPEGEKPSSLQMVEGCFSDEYIIALCLVKQHHLVMPEDTVLIALCLG